MGKGEIARYEQFLLFPQCFQNACFPGASKGVIVWEWVNVSNIVYVEKGHCPKKKNKRTKGGKNLFANMDRFTNRRSILREVKLKTPLNTI